MNWWILVALALVVVYLHTQGKSSPAFKATTSKSCILFFSPKCGYCHKFFPSWKKTQASAPFVMKEVDATDQANHQLVDKYKIEGFPTIVFEENGKEVMRQIGYVAPAEWEEKVRRFM